MISALYAIRGEPCEHSDKVRAWVKQHYGQIIRERNYHLVNGKPTTQFHVISDHDYWLLTAEPAYTWLFVRENCTCAEPICKCAPGLRGE